MTIVARDILQKALDDHAIEPIDFHFGCFLARQETSSDPTIAILAALVSNHLGSGHSCLPMTLASNLLEDWQHYGFQLPDATITTALNQSKVCGRAGDATPLVADQDNLFLNKYHYYEVTIAAALISRRDERSSIDEVLLKSRLDTYFEPSGDMPDWQRVSASIALTRNLAIITGGPGTGKTATVVRILALLLEDDPSYRIEMVAPTGKAAMRLSESVSNAVDKLAKGTGKLEEVRAKLPVRASTIHRLLGVNPTREQNRYGGKNHLPVDIMIVDEASMVDIHLMYQLVSALPDGCRLILLGDKDQLPSIEAGNLLADLCGQAMNQYSKPYHRRLLAIGNRVGVQASDDATTQISDCICSLQVSYRFPDDSTIGQLARAVNANDVARVSQLIAIAKFANQDEVFRFHELSSTALSVPDIAENYHTFLAEADTYNDAPIQAIQAFETYRVLCGVRRGPAGVDQINMEIEQHFRASGLASNAKWYHCRPIMITQNDYSLHLFNGDIGITLVDEEGNAAVYFLTGDNEVKRVLPARLPAHESCWAMTIHKTQGSEFDRIAIVLPQMGHLARLEFLSRELLYTAVTRARQQVTIYGYSEEISSILEKSARRSSGLADRFKT